MCVKLIMDQTGPSIRDGLDRGDADIDNSPRGKFRKSMQSCLMCRVSYFWVAEGVATAPAEAKTKVKNKNKD